MQVHQVLHSTRCKEANPAIRHFAFLHPCGMNGVWATPLGVGHITTGGGVGKVKGHPGVHPQEVGLSLTPTSGCNHLLVQVSG